MLKKIVLWVGLPIIAVVFILGSYSWFLGRQQRVLNGTASPNFPYMDRSTAELEQLYPQNPENNAPTVQSPEETHAKFLAAVKKGDFDEAVNCCFREGDRVGMKAGLEKLKEKGELKQMINDLDTDIKLDLENSWERTYTYSAKRNGRNIGTTIDFVKTTSGIWYIKSL